MVDAVDQRAWQEDDGESPPITPVEEIHYLWRMTDPDQRIGGLRDVLRILDELDVHKIDQSSANRLREISESPIDRTTVIGRAERKVILKIQSLRLPTAA